MSSQMGQMMVHEAPEHAALRNTHSPLVQTSVTTCRRGTGKSGLVKSQQQVVFWTVRVCPSTQSAVQTGPQFVRMPLHSTYPR